MNLGFVQFAIIGFGTVLLKSLGSVFFLREINIFILYKRFLSQINATFFYLSISSALAGCGTHTKMTSSVFQVMM